MNSIYLGAAAQLTKQQALRWFAFRLQIYFGIALAAGIAFVASVFIYSLTLPSVEKMQLPQLPESTPFWDNWSVPEGDPLVASGPGAVTVSGLIGTAILGPDNRTVGKVNEIVIDGSGQADYIVVQKSGGATTSLFAWPTSNKNKQVVIPFGAVYWVHDASAKNVRYGKLYNQSDLLPAKSSKKN